MKNIKRIARKFGEFSLMLIIFFAIVFALLWLAQKILGLENLIFFN